MKYVFNPKENPIRLEPTGILTIENKGSINLKEQEYLVGNYGSNKVTIEAAKKIPQNAHVEFPATNLNIGVGNILLETIAPNDNRASGNMICLWLSDDTSLFASLNLEMNSYRLSFQDNLLRISFETAGNTQNIQSESPSESAAIPLSQLNFSSFIEGGNLTVQSFNSQFTNLGQVKTLSQNSGFHFEINQSNEMLHIEEESATAPSQYIRVKAPQFNFKLQTLNVNHAPSDHDDSLSPIFTGDHFLQMCFGAIDMRDFTSGHGVELRPGGQYSIVAEEGGWYVLKAWN